MKTFAAMLMVVLALGGCASAVCTYDICGDAQFSVGTAYQGAGGDGATGDSASGDGGAGSAAGSTGGNSPD